MVLKCRCESDYQDKRYGNGNRVHNEANGKTDTYRCTVCGAERGLRG